MRTSPLRSASRTDVRPRAIDPLPDGTVDVWVLRLETLTAGEASVAIGALEDAERSRANRYRSVGDAHRFRLGRGLMRMVVANYVPSAPSEIRFDVTCVHCGGAHGKPRVPGFAGDLSVTRRQDLVLVAVAN